MSTPEKCPHCGSKRADGLRFTFDCGSAIYPNGDESRSNPCEVSEQVRASERAANAATKAEMDKVRAELAELRSRWHSAGTAVTAEITRIQGQRDKALNTVDLMRDEFQRIVARCVEFDGLESAFTQEIHGICDRARSTIEQRTDVIVQRDEWQRKAERLESALRLAADEPNIDRARQIADEAMAPTEASRE